MLGSAGRFKYGDFMVREIFDKYYSDMYSQYKTSNTLETPEIKWHEEKFVLVPHERVMRFTSLVSKPILDNRGAVVGKVRDLIMINPVKGRFDFPVVSGLVSEKRIIPWSDIASFGEAFVLNKRIFELAHPQTYSDAIFVGKRILDEQLVHENKNIGRVDDIKFAYDNKENKLKIIGICSGVLSRLGLKGFYDTIPWFCVAQIRDEKPTALVLDFKNKKLFTEIGRHDVHGICKMN